MQTLITLKKKALANPAWFKHLVVSGQLAKVVPQQQSVIRCPRVEWEKYGSMGMRLGRELDKPPPVEPLYTVVFGLFTWLIAGRPTVSSNGTQIGRTAVRELV
jgi:hypothetical protein